MPPVGPTTEHLHQGGGGTDAPSVGEGHPGVRHPELRASADPRGGHRPGLRSHVHPVLVQGHQGVRTFQVRPEKRQVSFEYADIYHAGWAFMFSGEMKLG